MLKRTLTIGILAVGLFLLTVGVAYAHYVYEDGYTYKQDGECVWNRAEVSHGNGGGYSKSTARLRRDHGIRPCHLLVTQADRKLRAKWALYHDEYYLCRSTSWEYNRGSATQVNSDEFHGNILPCGDGHYETVGKGQAHIRHPINGWRGGELDSGKHYLD